MSARPLIAALALSVAAGAATAEIHIRDAYARAAMPTAPTGAAFMIIENTDAAADTLVAAASDVAARVELHTHIADDGGIMQMREIEGGIEIPADGTHILQRGGDHVMFMGLTRPLVQGETVTVTLSFERQGDITVEIPVDLDRAPRGHGGMKHTGN